MLMTLYGDLEYGNKAALQNWIQAHDIAHRQYREAAAMAGNALEALLLGQPDIDNDWLGRHGLGHVALFRFAPTGSGLLNSITFSTVKDLANEDGFYDWHQRHDYVHSQINAAFGIT